MKRILLLFVPVLLLTQSLAAQHCDDIFKQVMDKVKSQRASAALRGFDLACQVRVTMDDGKVHTENMDIKMQGRKYQYTFQSTRLYQDDKTLVIVNSADHTVYLGHPLPATAQQNQFDQMIKLQDSLRNYFSIQSCEKVWGVVDKGTGYYKMVLAPKPQIKDMGVTSIVYSVDIDKMEVRKINIDYGPQYGDGIKSYELTVKRMDNMSQPLFEASALKMVMDGEKLRSQYTGYTLIDKRK